MRNKSLLLIILFCFTAAASFTSCSRTEAKPTYQCPMKCEGEKTYESPGQCPVCKMALEKVTPAKDNTEVATDTTPTSKPQ
jgi:protein SCO1/2